MNNIKKATYQGSTNLAGIDLKCAVIEGGKPGFLLEPLMATFGFKGKNAYVKFSAFLADVAPEALPALQKHEFIRLLNGKFAGFVSSDLLSNMALGIVNTGSPKCSSRLVKRCKGLLDLMLQKGLKAMKESS